MRTDAARKRARILSATCSRVFLSALRERGEEPAAARPRLTGPDGLSVELPERQRSQAELALADMIADAERLCLYDADPAEVRAALRAARTRRQER